jgi:hypothetical protein
MVKLAHVQHLLADAEEVYVADLYGANCWRDFHARTWLMSSTEELICLQRFLRARTYDCETYIELI